MSRKTGYHELVTLKSQATTTVLELTTSHFGSAISSNGFRVGIIMTTIAANASGSPAMYLDGSIDGSTWKVWATIHPDLTTTANSSFYNLPDPFPMWIRTRLVPSTTTSSVRYTVKMQMAT